MQTNHQPEATISSLQGDLPASLKQLGHCTPHTWAVLKDQMWEQQGMFCQCPKAPGPQGLGRHSIKPSRFSTSTPEKEPPSLSSNSFTALGPFNIWPGTTIKASGWSYKGGLRHKNRKKVKDIDQESNAFKYQSSDNAF